MIRVILADDHPVIREGLCHLLNRESNIEVVATASNGEEAIAFSRKFKPDVVVIDVSMPGIGGLEATHKIIRALPQTKIIALTAEASSILSLRMLRAGAVGYVEKSDNMQEVVKAIKTVYTGGSYLGPEIANYLALAKIGTAPTAFDSISNKEIEIILLLAQAMPVKTIAERLHLSEKTINTYRYTIFKKLDVRNNVEVILLAIREGLIDIPMPDVLSKEDEYTRRD